MKLTPMDINNKEFKRVLRGYCPEEVDEFLDQIVEEYEILFKENTALKEKLENSNDKICLLYTSEGKEYVMKDGDIVHFRFNV